MTQPKRIARRACSAMVTVLTVMCIAAASWFAAASCARAQELTPILKQGDAAREKSQYELALKFYLEELAARERRLGAEHPDLAQVLDRLGSAYRALKRHADELRTYARSLRIDEKHLGPDHVDVATDLTNVGDALNSLSEPAKALPLFQRALAIREKVLGPMHADIVEALFNLGHTYLALKQYPQAVQHYERSMRMDEKLLGPEHPDIATHAMNIARTHHESHNYSAAVPWFERAWNLRAKRLGESHRETLIAMFEYVSTLDSANRSAEALPLAERGYRLSAKALGEAQRYTLLFRAEIAHLLKDLGRTAEAIPHYEEILRLQRKSLGDKHPDILQSLGNYGAALYALGRMREALQVTEDAVKLRIESAGEKSPATLTVLNNRATILSSLGRHADALAQHQRVLTLRTEVLGERHAETLTSMNNYATALKSLGRSAEALPYFERVLKLSAEVMGEKHINTFGAIANYATILADAGRKGEAITYHERAMKARIAELGDTHPDTLSSFSNYALILHEQGRTAESLPYFERFVSGAEQQREHAARDSTESQRSTLASLMYGYHNYLQVLRDAGRLPEAFGILERTKARTLLEQMALRSATSSSGLPEGDAKRLVDLSAHIGALDSQLSQTASPDQRDGLRAERSRASRELDELKRGLQARYPRFHQITDVQLAGASDARALLSAHSVFVSYVVIEDYILRALTVDANGTVRWFDLPGFKDLADTIEALRVWSANLGAGVMMDDGGRTIQILRWQAPGENPRWRVITVGQACTAEQQQRDQQRANPPRNPERLAAATGNAGADCIPPGATFVSREAQYQELVDYLGKILIDPLKAELAGKTQLIISPDGPLGLVPWDILPLDGKPLIAQFEVSQVQSLSVLKLLKQRQAEYGQSLGREALLAMGNPEYGSAAVSAERGKRLTVARSPITAGAANPAEMLRNLKWAALPGTQAEMDQAAKIFAGQSRVISGKAASETTLRSLSAKGELANYRYLHFAAHGYFDPNFPAYSSLVLSPDGTEPERDGYVTIGEWVGMNLKSELTLLSACNTARGENVSGEGLMGLAYALYVAGNTNTVLTLWPVADDETAEFVVSLLSKIKAGQTHAQAITATKREFLNHANPSKRNPYFWAPFVLYGM